MAKASLEIGTVALQGCRCRCGHEWLPQKSTRDNDEKPRVCPKCKSANWDQPYRSAKKRVKAANRNG